MKRKVIVKVRVLIQGLYPISDFSIDGYHVKKEKVNEGLFNSISEESSFYLPLSILNSMFQTEHRDSRYMYFINNNLEFEISDVNELENFVKKKLIEQVDKLERKLKLITNIDICLPVIEGKIYNEENELLASVGTILSNQTNKRITDYDEETIELLPHRLRIRYSENSLEEYSEKNSRLARALNFYYDSFRPNNTSTRFVLLFSSLESLFNINKNKIAHNIAERTRNILFLDGTIGEAFYKRLKKLYDLRSRYLHGSKPKNISTEVEFELREIVRKVLLMYWYISFNKRIETANEIIKFIDNNKKENLDIQMKTFLSVLGDRKHDYIYEELTNFIKETKKCNSKNDTIE